MTSVIERLCNLPLFFGVTSEVMARTVGKYRFEFRKYQGGDTVISAGTAVNELIFILSGGCTATTELAQGIKITENIGADSVIYPEYLLGKSTSCPATVVAAESVSAVVISKTDFLDIIETNSVYKLNYLNLLSRKAQKSHEIARAISSGEIVGGMEIIEALIR